MSRITMIGAALVLVLPTRGYSEPERGKVIATRLFAVADDFIVEVYHNGVKVPDAKRTLLAEIHGATSERIDIEIRQGDWVVFNVVNNRLRWGGASYFGVTGRGDAGMAFTTELDSGRWSCCDDLGKVSNFVNAPEYLADNRAQPISTPWSGGDGLMSGIADGWTGKPIWGRSRNTWIKFVAR